MKPDIVITRKVVKEEQVEEIAKAQNKPAPDVNKNMGARQLDYIKNDIIIKKLFDMRKRENPVG